MTRDIERESRFLLARVKHIAIDFSKSWHRFVENYNIHCDRYSIAMNSTWIRFDWMKYANVSMRSRHSTFFDDSNFDLRELKIRTNSHSFHDYDRTERKALLICHFLLFERWLCYTNNSWHAHSSDVFEYFFFSIFLYREYFYRDVCNATANVLVSDHSNPWSDKSLRKRRNFADDGSLLLCFQPLRPSGEQCDDLKEWSRLRVAPVLRPNLTAPWRGRQWGR